MLVLLSQPLADLRSFLAQDTHTLAKPTFPTPIPGEHFVRQTGTVRSRRRGGSPAIGGEDVYCNAKKALRFVTDQWGDLYLPGNGAEIRCVFRRLYHTGRAAFRYDLGFVPDNAQRQFDARQVSDAADLCRSIAAIRVRVPTDASDARPLSGCGEALARHYLISTTELKNGNPFPVQDWWCRACPGMILLEYRESEGLRFPAFHSTIDGLADHGILLRHCRLEGAGSIISLWGLQYDPSADLRRVRQVRLHLTRVHTEFHCFHTVVNAARTDPLRDEIDVESGVLERYVQVLSNLLDKERRYGTPQKQILTTAFSLAGEAQPGALNSVLESASSVEAELQAKRKRMTKKEQQYAPQAWERYVASGMAVAIVATALFLVVRGEPFKDPNLVVLMRTLLSLATAVLGAIIPGFLRMSWTGTGLMIRAGGALALFVLTFLLTPTVLSS